MKHRKKSSGMSLHGRYAGGSVSLAALLMALGAAPNECQAAERTITIYALVPEGVGTVYLPGNRPELGSWDPQKLAMSGTGRIRTAVVQVPDGTDLEYKFTLGSWDREALGPDGHILPNYHILADLDKSVTNEISGFKKGIEEYIATWKESGVLGRLEYWKQFPSKYLALRRNVEIWFPPDYDENAKARYPVLYMHDGQNLFDPRLSFSGVDWGVDKAIVRGARAGRLPPAIVVGVWSTTERLAEYSPWAKGTNYARFLIDELMPEVNKRFRTLTGPEHTAVMGSSMGGMISFWLCWRYPDAFSRGGCLSTAWPWTGKLSPQPGAPPLIEQELKSGPAFPRGVRMYFDFGTREPAVGYETLQTKVTTWLTGQGLKEGTNFKVLKIEGAEHNEAAWRARLDEPMTFLLQGLGPAN